MKLIWRGLLFCWLAAAATGLELPDPALRSVASAYNAMGFQLLAQTRQAQPGKNIFLSPIGLALAGSMVANGANGQTLEGIRAALHLNEIPHFNEANATLSRQFVRDSNAVQVEIANSLWAADDAHFKAPFLDTCREYYRAKVAAVNFKDPDTAKLINDWCSEKTHGKIPSMVSPPLDRQRLILLDAIYFKGTWLKPFEKELTKAGPFALEHGQTIQQPMMNRTDHFSYLENEDFQAVQIPYGNRQWEMCIFLPKKSLAAFVASLTSENWEKWLLRFNPREGTISVPRFKVENGYDLKAALTAMGMGAAFRDGADFSRMSDEGLHIDQVIQKTYLEVNEEGTEAAAVTGFMMAGAAMQRPKPPFRMVVDRPFFLAIREQYSGALLFLGAINDPRQ